MNGPWPEGAPVGVMLVDCREGGIASPAFGGGGTGDGAAGEAPVTGGIGLLPGCGVGGE